MAKWFRWSDIKNAAYDINAVIFFIQLVKLKIILLEEHLIHALIVWFEHIHICFLHVFLWRQIWKASAEFYEKNDWLFSQNALDFYCILMSKGNWRELNELLYIIKWVFCVLPVPIPQGIQHRSNSLPQKFITIFQKYLGHITLWNL